MERKLDVAMEPFVKSLIALIVVVVAYLIARLQNAVGVPRVCLIAVVALGSITSYYLIIWEPGILGQFER